jgi:NADH:ubiquinone oxidoreductase subunit K
MTKLRPDDAEITAGQAGRAGETKALVKALASLPIALNAANLALVLKANGLAHPTVQLKRVLTNG